MAGLPARAQGGPDVGVELVKLVHHARLEGHWLLALPLAWRLPNQSGRFLGLAVGVGDGRAGVEQLEPFTCQKLARWRALLVDGLHNEPLESG